MIGPGAFYHVSVKPAVTPRLSEAAITEGVASSPATKELPGGS